MPINYAQFRPQTDSAGRQRATSASYDSLGNALQRNREFDEQKRATGVSEDRAQSELDENKRARRELEKHKRLIEHNRKTESQRNKVLETIPKIEEALAGGFDGVAADLAATVGVGLAETDKVRQAKENALVAKIAAEDAAEEASALEKASTDALKQRTQRATEGANVTEESLNEWGAPGQVGQGETQNLDAFINAKATQQLAPEPVVSDFPQRTGVDMAMGAPPQMRQGPPPMPGQQMQQMQQRTGVDVAMGAPGQLTMDPARVMAEKKAVFEQAEVERKELETVQAVQMFENAKMHMPESEHYAYDALIAALPEAIQIYGSAEKAIDQWAKGEDIPEMLAREHKRAVLAAKNMRSRRAAGGRGGGKIDPMLYERARTNFEQEAKALKMHTLKTQEVDLETALRMLDGSKIDQALAIQAMAKESMKGVLSDQDFNRFGGRRSASERATDAWSEWVTGSESERSIKDFKGAVRRGLKKNREQWGYGKKRLGRSVREAMGRDPTNRGDAHTRSYRALFGEDYVLDGPGPDRTSPGPAPRSSSGRRTSAEALERIKASRE